MTPIPIPIPFNRAVFHKLALDAIVAQGESSTAEDGNSCQYRIGNLACTVGTPDRYMIKI